MNFSPRERRLLLVWPFVIAAILIFYFSRSSDTAPVVTPNDSIASAEQRLQKLRQLAALAPAKEQVLKQANAQLADRERRVIQTETVAQAQAQILQLVRRLAQAQLPPLEVRGGEFGQARSLDAEYGEIPISVTMECRIEQLLNLISDLTAQPETIAVNELRIYAANPKEKTMNVRLTVSGLAPKRLVPQKKATSF